MPIQLIRVEGLTSVLGLSEGALKSYQEFLNAFKWLKEQEGKETIPKLIEEEVPQDLITAFFHIISDYLHSIGLEIGKWDSEPRRPHIYFRPDNTIEVCCKGIEIVPGSQSSLNGFEPELEFFIDLENPDEIKVTSQLKERGGDLSSLIAPTLLCFYLPKDDNSPIIKQLGERKIAMVSIEQISRFLENMRTIAQFLGDKKEKQLKEAETNIVLVPPEFKRAAKGIYALTLLETLGLEI